MAWKERGGAAPLQTIRCLLPAKTLTTGEQADPIAIWATVKAACETLHFPYSTAALAYFGYPYVDRRDGDAVEHTPALVRTQRKKAAARAIGDLDIHTFLRETKGQRSYGGQLYRTYEKLILAVVADALLRTPESSPTEDHEDPREDIRSAYRPTTSLELRDTGFFQRESTHGYISDIAGVATASGRPVTIYAGSGVSADLGEPQRSRFMERLLADALESAAPLRDVEEQHRLRRAALISDFFARTYPPAYLGSIVRELNRQRRRESPPHSAVAKRDEQLRNDIRKLLDAGHIPGAFLARAIAACAFAFRCAGASVEVVTSHYDDILIAAAEHIRTPYYLPGNLESYRFVATVASASDLKKANVDIGLAHNEVAVTHLNGTLVLSETPLVIGEGDFFAGYDSELHLREEFSSWRHGVLSDKLANSVCLFVGSTVTDPDVLEHLAQTKYRTRKYALVLAPDAAVARRPALSTVSAEGATSDVTSDEHVVRELISSRFLHLGVVPIIVDHPSHIPQFLREVALRVLQGNDYDSYDARAKRWWRYWSKAFGYRTPSGNPGRRNKSLQTHWHDAPLAAAVRRLNKDLAITDTSGEHIALEIWLRNPYQRELVLWARSDSLWLDGATANRASLRGRSGYIAQTTFEIGRVQRIAMEVPRSHWRFCWSIPLVLQQAPWYHLPVGVLNVLSDVGDDERDATTGTLVGDPKLVRCSNAEWSSRVQVEALEDRLRELVLRELDPKSSSWADREPWKPASVRRSRQSKAPGLK